MVRLEERMNEDEWATRLLSPERRSWQDPDRIVSEVGFGCDSIVADLGCGPGFFTIPIARKVCKKGHVYAIDSNSVMLEYLKDQLVKNRIPARCVSIINRELTDTQLRKNTLDFAFISNVLHDLNDRQAFFEEVKRITKKGGLVVNIDWKKEETDFGPPVSIRLDKEEVLNETNKNGLQFVREIDCGSMFYGLVFVKL